MRASDCSSNGGIVQRGVDVVGARARSSASSPDDFRDGDRFVGQRLAPFERAARRELRAQGREHERPAADRRRPRPIEGQFQESRPCRHRSHRRLATSHGRWRGRRPRVASVSPSVGGPPGGVEERVAECGVAGLALGGAEADGEVERQDRIGVGLARNEIEGLGVVAQALAGCERRERGVGGLARVVDGLGTSIGLGGCIQWRASSPTRVPGWSPHRSSSASATCRWLGPGGWGRGLRRACVG